MKILATGAIAIATVKMTIANISSGMISEKNEGSKKGFWVSVPSHVCKKLKVGDIISVVCTINKNLTFGTETLALSIYTSERSSTVLYDRDSYSGTMLTGIEL